MATTFFVQNSSFGLPMTKPPQEKMEKLLPVKPLGHHVLIEIVPVKFTSSGGILLSSANEQERERKGRDLGRILAFGPTAYLGFEGCKSHKDWGVDVGDVVELKGRYDGKFSSVADYDDKYKSLRYVSDSDIIGIFSKEMVGQLEEVNKHE
jgi:co-chaperonin GroES (HSP10)